MRAKATRFGIYTNLSLQTGKSKSTMILRRAVRLVKPGCGRERSLPCRLVAPKAERPSALRSQRSAQPIVLARLFVAHGFLNVSQLGVRKIGLVVRHIRGCPIGLVLHDGWLTRAWFVGAAPGTVWETMDFVPQLRRMQQTCIQAPGMLAQGPKFLYLHQLGSKSP